MEITNYNQALKYLESFIGKIKFEITPEFIKKHDPLERMRVLLSVLGNPQNKFQSVLVGGTSGKGSAAYLISHILRSAGYKTGLTISPHLQKVNERIQIDAKQITDGEFTSLMVSILDSIEGMKRMVVGAPSYFEIIIAMAFLYLAQQKVDIAVVEVGMGGEFDATNTLYPLVAVLTNVSLDHTNILGGTVEKIARTKAGIIKGSPHPLKVKSSFRVEARPSSLIVVIGVKQPSVIKIVEEKCREADAKLYRLYKDFDFKIKKENIKGSVFDLTTDSDRVLQLNNLRLSLLGRYQVANASLAIATTLQLRKFGFKVSEENIREALKTAFFPGRFEVISIRGDIALWSPRQFSRSAGSAEAPRATIYSYLLLPNSQLLPLASQLILDGAHNPTKMRAFLSTLKKLYPRNKKVFVIAFKNDKDIKGMLRQILRLADKIIVTQFSAKTDMNKNASSKISNIKYQISNIKTLKKKIRVLSVKSSETAMEKAFEIAKTQKDSIIVVTGSLYLVGEIRSLLK